MSTITTEPVPQNGRGTTKSSGCTNRPGDVFGELTIRSISLKRVVMCLCSCGREKETSLKRLRAGNIRSCGCLREKAKIKHGCSFNGRKTKEYRAWRYIKDRTCNPNYHTWPSYGGRGITICAEWRDSFPRFLAHIGPAPSPQHTVDRIDTEKGYEPGNVRWATRLEQSRNSRSNVLNMELAEQIRLEGETGLTTRLIADKLNVAVHNVKHVLSGRCWVASFAPDREAFIRRLTPLVQKQPRRLPFVRNHY